MAGYVEYRLIDQYRESPLLMALLMVLIDNPLPDIETALEQLSLRLSIDDMTGKNLDAIGEIVGLKRPASLGDETEYYDGVFTYSSSGALVTDKAKGYGFGEYPADVDFSAMGDADYRRFLKAKIIKNNSNKTILDCQKAAQLILGEPYDVTEYTNTVRFRGERPPAPVFVATLKAVVPVAGGILVTYEQLP